MMLVYCTDLEKHFILPDLTIDWLDENDFGRIDDITDFDGNGFVKEENAIRFGIFLIHFYEMVDWF